MIVRRINRMCRLRRLPKQDILIMALALGMFTIYMMYNVGFTMGIVEGKKNSAVPQARDKEEEDAGGGAHEVVFEGLGQTMNDYVHHRNILEGMEVEEKQDNEQIKLTEFQIYLNKLETRLLEKQQQLSKVAYVRGQLNIIQRDLPFYETPLRQNGFRVKKPEGIISSKLTEQNGTLLTKFEEIAVSKDLTENENVINPWMLMLCMTYSDGDKGDCIQRETIRHLQAGQKVNRIPGIRETLWRKDKFCSTMNAARRIPALRKGVISPVCWVLPMQYEQFLGVADALGTDARWVVKSTAPGGAIQLLQPTRDRDFAKVKQYSEKNAVVQQYFPNPLLVFGMPVSVRAHVLVTSIAPLTVYIHSQGIVHYRQDYQKHFKKVPNRTWLFSQLKTYLSQTYGKNAAKIAFENMGSVIVQTLLVVESSLEEHFKSYSTNRNSPFKCKHCFQLLGFDLIFNSTLHPVIIEVNGHPDLDFSKDANEWSAGDHTQQTVIDDTLKILFSNSSVALDVAEALETLNLNIGIKGLNCQSSHQLCLTDGDLEYLMGTHRQKQNKGQFQQLYPSTENHKYNSLIKDLVRLQNSKQKTRQKEPVPTDSRHSTPDLHPVITAVESFFHGRVTIQEQGYSQEQDAIGSVHRAREDVRPIHDVFDINNPYMEKYKKTQCSEDRQTMPYISGIFFEPNISFSPEFDPYTSEYYAKVPYDTMITRVWAHSMNCDCEVRLEDKYGLSRPANYSIGIGDNRVNLLVVDITHTEPWVINTYVVHVYREGLSEHEQEFKDDEAHQVCSLIQECDLKFIPFDRCGLNRMPYSSWPAFLQQTDQLPLCKAGDSPGQWTIPCGMCNDRNTCFFRKARWQPYTCRHAHMTHDRLQECMAGKRVIFLGDSTNRGIMYYIMEQVNGTLNEWDKTHDIKIYNNLNHNRTSTVFGYFPQFMIPANQRPMFDKAFMQVLAKAMPLENNVNTVIVIGGVHWLATHHLKVVKDILLREGLSDVTLIMKSLGAGFHQTVDGIHYLTPKEQHKVLLHNQGLIQQAQRLGFEVIDTFNITMARYKDFLQGKCSCHFHKVQEIVGTTPGSLPQPPQTKHTKIYRRGMAEESYNYHVHGDINALYSEILLNRICDP
ncbi:cadherin-like and PC-esterase domain-containing protein 1 [Antedon mediterranea]|uniref:cadherin-like and PC-esterase domain-containing protein 1 n=1 Tax=Antedon mediterranea TaxID=105859 RepID=UPI003AF775C2